MSTSDPSYKERLQKELCKGAEKRTQIAITIAVLLIIRIVGGVGGLFESGKAICLVSLWLVEMTLVLINFVAENFSIKSLSKLNYNLEALHNYCLKEKVCLKHLRTT